MKKTNTGSEKPLKRTFHKSFRLVRTTALMTCLTLSLAACGSKEDKDSSDSTTGSANTAAVNEATTEANQSSFSRVSQDIIDNMAPATDTEGLTVTDEMYEKAIFNSGNTARLEACMEKAARGESVTIAYIGGSITNGSNASPQASKCYAALSTKWWEDTFPNAEIKYVNAGIGGTDSWLGVHRASEEVISEAPDLVIVEFSVNDYQTLNKETYDSLIRYLLTSDSEPAVISLMLAQKNGGYAKEHAPIAFKYKVPMISYSALLTGGLVPWDKVGATDGVHPVNSGHSLIANLLTTYYRSVLENINDHESEGYTVPDISQSQTRCRYLNSSILYSDSFTADEMTGFTAGKVWSPLTNTNGWSTTSSGTISFTVNAKEIGIIFMQTNKEPDKNDTRYDVYVDDEFVCTIKGYESATWGQHLEYASVLLVDDSATHTVSLKPNSDSIGNEFTIMGIGITE